MYKVVAPVVVELIFVQVSGEQRARTRLHATHLHQLTLRLCSAVFIGTCIPLHALSYACMLHGHIPTCMYMQCAAETTFSFFAMVPQTAPIALLTLISVARQLRKDIPIGQLLLFTHHTGFNYFLLG